MTRPVRLFIAEHDREAFREGVRSYLPMVLPVAIWGLVTGVAIVNAGMPLWEAIVLSIPVYAGSAQLAVLPLLVAGAPLPVVWATALLVNLRFVIFSAASRSYFTAMSAPQRLMAGYINGDLGFAMFSGRFRSDTRRNTPQQYGFFYGINGTNWLAWHGSSVIGMVVGNLAPTAWGLELAATMALLAVLIPLATRFPAVAGVVVTGVLAVLTAGMPMKLGLLISVLVGATVAVTAETVQTRRSAS
ncbi:MAG: AzlC family ABC transporter permease [Actinomycetota bacterium]